MFDVEKIRSQFPILERKIRGKNFIYFDNAPLPSNRKE